jgi:hypothetical protein
MEPTECALLSHRERCPLAMHDLHPIVLLGLEAMVLGIALVLAWKISKLLLKLAVCLLLVVGLAGFAWWFFLR